MRQIPQRPDVVRGLLIAPWLPVAAMALPIASLGEASNWSGMLALIFLVILYGLPIACGATWIAAAPLLHRLHRRGTLTPWSVLGVALCLGTSVGVVGAMYVHDALVLPWGMVAGLLGGVGFILAAWWPTHCAVGSRRRL